MDAAIQEWLQEGCVLLPEFFTEEEMAPLHADFEAVFGAPGEHFATRSVTNDGPAGAKPNANENASFSLAQFKNFQNLPFHCSPALNLIAVHPKLITLAQQALGTKDVLLYQGQAWAKYTGEANYDQPFHCDFGNHTLTVPADDAAQNSITFIILVTNVSESHGPTHYVPKSLSAPIADATVTLHSDPELTRRLLPHARSTAAASGALFAYGIDVYHRGTNLTAPNGHRYVVTSCFKRADNNQIGYTAWPFHTQQPWQHIFNHASPEQLHCFGVPLPGDTYWTRETIRLTRLRWPDWDASPWLAAL